MWRSAVLATVLAWLPLIGCDGADRQEAAYRLEKARSERDRLEQALEDERAKLFITQERLAAAERERESAQAELDVQRAHIRQLDQKNRALLALIEQRSERPLEPPKTPASPLPVEVDEGLQAYAERHRDNVTYERGRAALSFANDRMFAAGSDEVGAQAQRRLGELAGIAALTSADDYEIIVVGHTDDTPIGQSDGRFRSNWHLSVCRAIAVKNVLVAAGLPEARLGVMGYGPHRPIGTEQARNRRVEVFFARKGELKPRPPIRVSSTRPL